MLSEGIGQSIVHVDFQTVFVEHEDFIREMTLFTRLNAEHVLQISVDELLNLVAAELLGGVYLSALGRVFKDLFVLIGFLASRAEYFQNLENLLNFIVDLLRLLLGLAERLRAHPDHSGVHAGFTVERVAG